MNQKIYEFPATERRIDELKQLVANSGWNIHSLQFRSNIYLEVLESLASASAADTDEMNKLVQLAQLVIGLGQ